MNRPKIKICGLTRIEDIQAVNLWKPEYIGFVFAKSRRQLTPKQAKALKEGLSPDIRAVGVFVNEALERVISLCREGVIEGVQLHGEEDEGYIRDLKSHIRQPVIKAVRVKNRAAALAAKGLDCDFLLFDAYSKKAQGGTGETFDPSLLSGLSRPFFLAGGLKEENVLEKIKTLHPYAVDISSGVETNGKKDPVKIRNIIKTIREERL